MVADVTWEPYLSDVPVPTDAIIAAAEARIGARFPADIRPYFLNCAGRVANPETIAVGRRVMPVGPLVLFIDDPAHPLYSYALASALEAITDWAGHRADHPIRFLPFADDMENGRFCFDLGVDPDAPPVVFVDLECDPTDARSLQKVAPSFTAFLGMLVCCHKV
jgi:SMI1 / KNR4 family (SUKH-1)